MAAPDPPASTAAAVARDRGTARSAQWLAAWMVLGNIIAAALASTALVSRVQGPPAFPGERETLIGINVAFVVIGAAMAWRIRKGPARWPIVVLLLWLLLETAGKVTGPRPLGAVIDVIFLGVGVRALVAAHALRGNRGRGIDLEVF